MVSARLWCLTGLALAVVACRPAAPELNGIVFDAAPQVARPTRADFNAMLVYLGLDVTPVAPRTLRLAHLWEVLTPPGQGWKVRVMLEGAQEPAALVAEHEAARGVYPIGRWSRGDFVRDEHDVVFPDTWKAATATVIVVLVNGPSKLPIIVGPKRSENQLVATSVAVPLP